MGLDGSTAESRLRRRARPSSLKLRTRRRMAATSSAADFSRLLSDGSSRVPESSLLSTLLAGHIGARSHTVSCLEPLPPPQRLQAATHRRTRSTWLIRRGVLLGGMVKSMLMLSLMIRASTRSSAISEFMPSICFEKLFSRKYRRRVFILKVDTTRTRSAKRMLSRSGTTVQRHTGGVSTPAALDSGQRTHLGQTRAAQLVWHCAQCWC